MNSAINTRMGAQVLVENNVFRNVVNPLTSVDSKENGYVSTFILFLLLRRALLTRLPCA